MEQPVSSWLRDVKLIFQQQIEAIREKDQRFFRLEEFWRNICRVDQFASNCPECNRFKPVIREQITELHAAISSPGKARRRYDTLTTELNKHMREVHHFFPPYYFTYRYSFFGMLGGAIPGFIIDLLVKPNAPYVTTIALLVLGLIIGQVKGGKEDSKIRIEKRLL